MAKLTQITLLIDRDATTKLPVVVFDYEQPILEEIYGEEQVFEVEGSLKEVDVPDFDVRAAFDGLVNKYAGNAEAERARKSLYPKLRDLEKRIGVSAAAAKPADAEDESDPIEALAKKTVAEIVAALPSLADDELSELEDAEKAGKDRSGVYSAIEAERANRAEQ